MSEQKLAATYSYEDCSSSGPKVHALQSLFAHLKTDFLSQTFALTSSSPLRKRMKFANSSIVLFHKPKCTEIPACSKIAIQHKDNASKTRKKKRRNMS
jgi:hypothetical protein